LTGISYDFGLSTVARTRIGSLESYNCYFPKGHGRPLGSESVSNPRLVEAMVFEDFFAAGVCMPPHSILVDITMSYTTRTRMFIFKGPRLLSLLNLFVSLFTLLDLGIG
jgi:hypothetical protein